MSEYGEFTPFLEAMKAEYLRHYPEKGDSWKEERKYRHFGSSDAYPTYYGTDGYLRRLLSNCFRNYAKASSDPSELVDIALLCGMLWLRSSEKTEAS
jgi:hypothetical protein